MAAKSKKIVISLMLIILTLCVFDFFLRKYDASLFSNWVTSYDNGNDIAAKDFAKKMDWFDEQGSAYYLAHIDVSDSIHLSGRDKTAKLLGALDRLEKARFTILGANKRPFVMLKASINALLGDKQRADEYAKKACKLNRPMTVEECLNGPLSFDDPEGSRWMAVQYYEQAILYNVVGSGDKTRSKFYEAVALKYFDVASANLVFKELVRDGHVTSEMRKTYCNPVSPVDSAVCKGK